MSGKGNSEKKRNLYLVHKRLSSKCMKKTVFLKYFQVFFANEKKNIYIYGLCVGGAFISMYVCT